MDEGESWRRIARDEDGDSERRSDACNFEYDTIERLGLWRDKEDRGEGEDGSLNSPRDGPP